MAVLKTQESLKTGVRTTRIGLARYLRMGNHLACNHMFVLRRRGGIDEAAILPTQSVKRNSRVCVFMKSLGKELVFEVKSSH